MVKSAKIGLAALATVIALAGTLAFTSPMAQLYIEKVFVTNPRTNPIPVSEATETSLVFQQTVTVDAEHQNVVLGPFDVRKFRQLRLSVFHVSGTRGGGARIDAVSSDSSQIALLVGGATQSERLLSWTRRAVWSK